MTSSGIRNIIQLLSIFLLLNIVFAIYEVPYEHRQPYALSNQRSADSGYKYAWFTRDIHDDINSGEEKKLEEQELSPEKAFRLKMLKSIFNRKHQTTDENLSESNEKL